LTDGYGGGNQARFGLGAALELREPHKRDQLDGKRLEVAGDVIPSSERRQWRWERGIKRALR